MQVTSISGYEHQKDNITLVFGILLFRNNDTNKNRREHKCTWIVPLGWGTQFLSQTIMSNQRIMQSELHNFKEEQTK